MARTRGPQKLSFVRNPLVGTILAASAGGHVEAEFDFVNDSPEVAAFDLAVDGLPLDWLNGVGPQAGRMVAASGDGSLRFGIHPPHGASVGEYDFSVRILSGGDAISSATALVLRVDPADENSVVPEVSEPVALPPMAFVPEPEVVSKTPPAPPPAAKPKPAPRRRAVSVRPPEPEPAFASAPVPAPESEPVFIEPEPIPVALPLEPMRIVPEPARNHLAAPPSPASPQPVPRPRPAVPPPVEGEPVIVDYQPQPSRRRVVEEEQEPQEEEATLVDLPDGGAVALKPGETKLLRFSFFNETPREATYVLDEDQSLPEDWIMLVQDQVNLTRSGKGDVSLRLTPPLNAEPGDYPFGVTLGQQGGILTSRFLTLTVQATPAVRLAVKEKTLKIGPMGSFADFPLVIESAGNADTAFRIAVKPTQGKVEGRDPAPVYGTVQWQYLFDKELETLRSPTAGRAPRPVPIRLRLQRKGPWWFGFRETHLVHVVAVPVTDASNGGKPGNTLEIAVIRQRFWPMPYLTLIPLFLLLLVLSSGGADDLSVAGVQYQENDTYWVVNPANSTTKATTLKWEASPTAFLRVSGEKISSNQASSEAASSSVSQNVRGSGNLPCWVTVGPAQPDVEYHYKVNRLVGGGDRDVFVHYIYTRRDTPLKATYQDAAHSSYAPILGFEITLTVPKKGYAHLNLKNQAVTHNNDTLDLNYWIVHQPNPKTSAFALSSIVPQGTIAQQQTKFPLISLRPNADMDDNKIVIVTSDADHPLLTVTLKKEGAANQ